MNWSRLIVVTAFATASAVQASAAQAARQPESIEPSTTGALSGRVLDADGKAPLAGVSVGSKSTGWVTTASDGRYTLTRLNPGPFTVHVRSNYVSTSFAAPVSATVTAGKTVTVPDILVRLPGRISGRVLDADGAPILGLRVLLVGRAYSRRGWFPVSSELGQGLVYARYGAATTDDRGAYTFANVPAGRNHWVVAVRPKRAVAMDLTAPQPAGPVQTPMTTYYPSAISFEGAVPIVLRSLEHRENVDIRVEKVAGRCLDATLIQDGAGLTMEFVVQEMELAKLRSVNLQEPGADITGRTGRDGKLRVCGLAPGQYQLTAAEFLNSRDRKQHAAAVSVSIERQDVNLGEVFVIPPVTITGNVIWPSDAGHAPPERVLYLSLWPPPSVPAVPVKAYDAFSFQVAPISHHSLSVWGLKRPYFVESVAWNARPVDIDDVAFLAPPVSPGQLEIRIGAGCGSLAVTVQKESGEAMPAGWVLVKPTAVATEAALAATMIVGMTDANGVYVVPCLAPGDYQVFAPHVPPPGVVQVSGQPVIDRTPEVMSALLSSGIRWEKVKVPSGAEARATVRAR